MFDLNSASEIGRVVTFASIESLDKKGFRILHPILSLPPIYFMKLIVLLSIAKLK